MLFRSLKNRLPRIIEATMHLNADLVALQEVEDFERDYAQPLSSAGYAGHFKKRTGDAQRDGVALVWRTSRLTLLHIEDLEYAHLLTEGVADLQAAEKLRKPHVGVVGVFRDNQCGRELVVATTHLLWNPKRGLVKLRQLQCLLGRVAALRAGIDERARAVVVLGDMNCTPGSPLHQFLLTGVLRAPLHTEAHWDGQRQPPAAQQAQRNVQMQMQMQWQRQQQQHYHHQQHQQHHQQYQLHHQQWQQPGLPPLPPPLPADGSTVIRPPSSACPPASSSARDSSRLVEETHALADQLTSAYGWIGEPQCTSFHSGFQGTVDYVLLTAEQLVVQQLLPTPMWPEIAARRSLPDWHTPSDHLPIAADLRWRHTQPR